MAKLLVLLALALIPLQAASAAAQPSASLPLRGWQFRTDPSDIGVQEGWARGFRAERTVETGKSLDLQGLPEFRGVAWYSRSVAIPDGWRRVLLGFGAVDVACDVYVNGQLAGHFEDRSLGARAAVVDMTSTAPAGTTATLVIRLLATGGAGGIKQEVRLGQTEAEIMTAEQYVLRLHDQHPEWRLPAWASGGRRAWVVTGVEGAIPKGIVAVDGSFSPWARSYGVSIWLFDPAAGRMVDFPEPSAHLRDGSSPLPVFDFESGPWRLREELAASGPPGSPSISARISLESAPHEGRLYLALRPYSASGGTMPIREVDVKDRTLRVDGHLALRCSACNAGGTLPRGDVSSLAAAGRVPAEQRSFDRTGWAQGLMAASLEPGSSIVLTAPQTLTDRAGDPADFEASSAAWQRRLHQVELHLPDARLQSAYYASLGYILVEERGDKIHPGPLTHDNFWVRDAALIGYALERAGHAASVRPSAEQLLAAIDAQGAVAAVSDSDGHPLPKTELDAPGEAAFGLAEYARYSGDDGFLRRAFPAMARALHRAVADRDQAGLVPANESAEDLGPATDQHYWDDLWLLSGLREGAWAAKRLGLDSDAREFYASFDNVHTALLASIRGTGKPFISDGPTGVLTPGMARGASPSLWPEQVLDPSSALARDSFRYYYQQFVAPNGGAYSHLYGQWWPYGGLELAHDALFLGMREELGTVLDYTLDHQTAPGLFAWAEGVDATTGGFGEGDMPHAWASAELVNLVRDMLLYENGDHLVIGGGVPASWRGQLVEARHMPTHWGLADVVIQPDGTVSVTGIEPPGSVELRLPFPGQLAV